MIVNNKVMSYSRKKKFNLVENMFLCTTHRIVAYIANKHLEIKTRKYIFTLKKEIINISKKF